MLFIMTFRGKLGIVCIAGGAIYVIKSIMSGLDAGFVFAKAWPLLIALLLLGVSFLLPDIVYLATDPRENWKRWGIALRFYEYKDFKYISFVRYYPKTKCALTQDEIGRRVFTNLLRCTCRDYKKNRRPCVHMHKLAYKLGVHD